MPATAKEQPDDRADRSILSKLPMWDSSDPDRNPPPLPLNPQASPATVRPGAAASIVQAAQMFTETPRESSISSNYTTNSMPERSLDRSPERSLIKGAAHRRLQSVRDIRNVLDGRKTPERSPERSITPALTSSTSPDTPKRAETPTRRSSVRPTKAILGENTPPSATMLALQTMTVRDFPEPIAANSSNGTITRAPQNFETILDQMASLTNIATNLQKEMAHLTRRSKDNASDLMSLKEATNSRDEDIRKSLKDLLSTVANSQSTRSQVDGGAVSVGSRAVFDAGGATTPTQPKSYTLPRMTSPGPMFEDGITSRIESPRPFSVEGAASVAMLEKIIREMVTKDGQERLLSQLNELFEKASQENSTTAKKVADLVEFIKEGPDSQALVHAKGASSRRPRLHSNNSTSSALMLGSRDVRQPSSSTVNNDGISFVKPADFVNDEVISLLKKIKDSVFHSGQVVSEVKAQQRDLRHEVLGIGRNLAQKIDEARKPASRAKAIEDGSGKQDIARIVTEGLSELKAHLDTVMREKRRQSTSSNISRATVDNREIYDVVKHSLNEHGLGAMQIENTGPVASLDKEAIVEAIKEAYEAYQPNIKVQQFGLERDEILECLKEGLETYQTSSSSTGLNRAEILEVIHEGMATFNPPKPINDVHEVREEVLSAVRECLDELRPSLALQPLQTGHRNLEALPELIADAVKTGLRTDGPMASQQLEICADDLFDAVTRALDESRNPLGRFGDEIRNSLTSILSELHEQFKQYSAAHGRDTEQVLDAMRDGQENLRSDIEQYVDRAQDVTGKDEIIDEVRKGVSQILQELESSITHGPRGDGQLDMDFVRSQFERLDDTVSNLAHSEHHRNVLEALHLGFDEIRTLSGSRGVATISDDNAFGEAVRGELESVRDAVIMRSEGHKEEVLDSVKIGFDILEAKIGAGAFDEVKSELECLRSALSDSGLKESSETREMIEDIHINLKDLKTRIVGDDATSATLLATIHAEFQNLRASLQSGTMSRSIDEEEDDEVVDGLRDTIDAVKQASNGDGNGLATEALKHVSVKLGEVAQAVNNNRDNSKADYEDLLTTVRCGLDDLRADVFKKLDNPDQQTQAYGQILDTINESSEALKTELAETINKPTDLTVCYDILEALKEGVVTIKTDIAALKASGIATTGEINTSLRSNEIVLSDGQDAGTSRAVAAGSLHRDDLTQVEVMLASLQVKVDAMSASISDIPINHTSSAESATTTDVGSLENMLKDMQATMDLIVSREDGEGTARKEDTDAIETLLRNTKAHLEEIHPSGSASGITSDQVAELSEKLDNVIGGLSEELKEDIAKKEDFEVLQQLVLDLKPLIDDVKNTHHATTEEQSKSLGVSIDALQLLALEVKEKVLEVHEHNSESKKEVQQLTGLIHDFRDSHDRLKDSYENDISITARAFDDRKKEAENIVDSVQLLRDSIDLLKLDMSTKLTSTGDDVILLSSNVTSMEDTIKEHFAINEAVREIREKVEREFERVIGVVEALKTDNDTHAAAMHAKNDEARLAVVEGVTAKISEHYEILAAKHDDARAESLAATAAQRDILDSTKASASDLQISVDTLGATVTGLQDDCERLTHRVAENSEAVFNKIDNGFAGLRDVESRVEAGKEHAETRGEVQKVLSAIDSLQCDVTEYHPRFMVTLQEIHELVNQQMDHAKKTKEELAERDRAHQEHSRSITDEIKTSFSSLPMIMPAPLPALESGEKSDHSAIHAKLDEVLLGMADSSKAAAQLEYLQTIQDQVAATSAQLTAFVENQSSMIVEGSDSKQKDVHDSQMILERHRVEKDQLQLEVTRLQSERDSIRMMVEELRAERDSLATEKAKLAADVSALNTALHIRKEELHAMDHRADALERRILEGIMDQSRAMLLARGMKEQNVNSRAMRAPSNASHSTVGSLPPAHPAANGLAMAIKTRATNTVRRIQQQQQTSTANTGRRILSLSQITGNTPTGGQAHRPLPAIPNSSNALAAPGSIMKRSQSVRTAGARKVSWNTRNAEKRHVSNGLIGAIHEDEDKENDGNLHDIQDEDESRSIYEDESVNDCGASTGTVNVHDIEHESVSSRRESAASTGTHESYETGDYMTGSDLSRRTSEITDAIHEASSEDGEGEEDDGREEEQRGDEMSIRDFAHEQVSADKESGTRVSTGTWQTDSAESEYEAIDGLGPLMEKELVIRPRDADADSGIGIDPPTALMRSDSEASYFGRRSVGESTSGVAGQ